MSARSCVDGRWRRASGSHGSPCLLPPEGSDRKNKRHPCCADTPPGSVIPVTGGFFSEPSGTTFASSDPYFDSTSEGYYGIVYVTMTSNVQFDGENYTSDNTDVANFCVVLATSE